jgi:hypothetical protein
MVRVAHHDQSRRGERALGRDHLLVAAEQHDRARPGVARREEVEVLAEVVVA